MPAIPPRYETQIPPWAGVSTAPPTPNLTAWSATTRPVAASTSSVTVLMTAPRVGGQFVQDDVELFAVRARCDVGYVHAKSQRL